MVATTHLPDRHRNDPWKVPCRAATTANITIATALNNADTLDGVTLATGDRVLVKNQSAGAENGIYVVGPSPARALDFDTEGDILGAVVVVLQGTVNADTMWLCTTNATITVGTTALVFVAAGAGGVTDHGALTGLGDDDHPQYVTDADVAAHTGDTTDAHDASAISVVPAGNITSTDVQAALAELDGDITAGGIPATIVDAKGDLIAGTAADTVARLAVGANGLFLKADSTQTTGLVWAAGGALPVPSLLQSVKGSADTPDDDFPGTSLDAKWTAVDGTAGAVSLFGGSGGIYEVGERTGWLAMQVGTASGDSVVLRQDYTLPDGNCIVTYIALATDEVTTAGASNEVRASLCVNDNDTGPEAGAAGQTLLIMWDSDGSGVMSIDAFDGTTVLGTIAASAMYVGGCFFRIDRSGLVYRAMISFDGWSWTLLATKTMATAANNIYLTGECRATMANRVIIAVPWIRQGTALAMDPWPL